MKISRWLNISKINKINKKIKIYNEWINKLTNDEMNSWIKIIKINR